MRAATDKQKFEKRQRAVTKKPDESRVLLVGRIDSNFRAVHVVPVNPHFRRRAQRPKPQSPTHLSSGRDNAAGASVEDRRDAVEAYMRNES